MDEAEKSRILRFAVAFKDFNSGDLETLYEPLSDSPIGKRLFEMGIGRKARREINELVERILEINPPKYPTNMHPRSNRLYSIPASANRVVDELSRKLFSDIPKEIVDIVLESTVGISAFDHLPNHVPVDDGKKMAKIDYYPAISHVAMPVCNRGCKHCSTMATPSLANITFDEIKRGFEKLPPSSSGVCFTVGEPFRWTDAYRGMKLNLGDVISHLLERSPGCQRYEIVTSGINFEDPIEAGAAATLKGLPEHEKRKIQFILTLSDFPHIRMRGLTWPEAARTTQISTIRFAIENGFQIGFISFLDHKRYVSEICRPLLKALVPQLDNEEAEVFRIDGQTRKGAVKLGRAGSLIEGEFPEALTECGTPSCMSHPGILMPAEKRRTFKERTMWDRAKRYPLPAKLILSPGGDLGPGCCMPPSHHAVISNIDKSYREIKEDTVAFVRRLERMRMSEGLSCIRCIGSADHIRDPERFMKAVGPDNSRLISANKLARR